MTPAETERILDSWTDVLEAVRSSQALTFSIRRLCQLETLDRLAATHRLAESMLANGEDKDLVAFVRALRDPRMCRAVLEVVPPLPIGQVEKNRLLWIFFGSSILLHILLLLLIFSGLIARLQIPEGKEKPNRITLTLVPKRLVPESTPPPPSTVPSLDTTGLPTLPAPDPKAAFEGEANTAAMSRLPGQGNPNLPNQMGEVRPGMEFFNSNYSPEQVTPLTPPPSPETPPAKASPAAAEPAETAARKQALKENLRTGSASRIQTGESEKEPRETKETKENKETPRDPKKTEQAQEQTPTPPQKTDPAQAPAAFSAYKRENRIEGSAPGGPANSAAARESEIGRYKAKLYRAIGSRWYAYVHQDTGTISLGIVRLRFFVRHDGVILPPEVVDGGQHAALLAVSRRSVMEVSGQLEPFSDNMRQQLGDGYYEEVSFSIY